jgi:hypothetical protein
VTVYRVLVAVNLAVAAGSAGFFALTVVGQEHVKELAKDYLAAKVRPVADRLAAQTARAFDSKAGALVPGRVRVAIRAELDAYGADPVGTIREWAKAGADAPQPNIMMPGLDEAFGLRDRVKAHFDATFASLIRDLRIFSGSNAVAGLLAAWLASRSRGRHRYRLAGLSLLLLAGVAWNAWMYLDDLTFFRILIDSYAGWGYPVFLAVTVGYLWFRIGRLLPPAPPRTASPWLPAQTRR